MDIIAYRLRELRRSKKLSQDAVAQYLGISRTAYNKYENGAIKPVRKICELANLFNVSTDYLLGMEKTGSKSQLHAIEPQITEQLNKYLSLSEKGKEIVDIIVDTVYYRENLEGCVRR